MPVQEIVWTALPRSRTAGVLGVGDRLNLSVLVSPRLGTDVASGGGTPAALRLDAFPDFANWPAAVRDRLRLSLLLDDGPPLAATVTSQPDSNLWGSLFPPDTLVAPFRFDDLSTTLITSPPVPSAADALKGLWVLAASRFGGRIPSVGELDEILTEAGVRGGSGPSGGLPPPVPDPGTGPRPGGESTPGYPGVHAGLHVGVDLGLQVDVDVVIDVLLGKATEATAAARPRADGETALAQPPAAERAAAVARRERTRDDVRASLEGVTGAYAGPPGSPSGGPPDDELTRSLDFHRMVAVLSQHPELLRRLGLVLDLEVPLLPTVLGSRRAERARLHVAWTAGQPTVNHCPVTACILDDKRFLVAPKPEGSDLRDGLLRRDDTSRFRVEQFDVDAGTQKVQSVVPTIDAVLARIQRGETLNTPEEAGLPTLRAAGIMVVHEDEGSGGQPVRNTAGPVVARKVADGAALDRQLQQTRPAPGSSGSSQVGPLYADHLTTGYRVDVWDNRSDAWHSLCRRDATYRFVDGPAAGTTIKVPGGEGFIEATASGVPGTALSVPAQLCTWEGWSLAAPRPGLVLGLEDELVTEAEVGGPPLHVAVTTSPTPGSLPRLRFGRWYRVRARAVDVAGNSLPLAGPPKNTPEASAAVLYSRMEPVASPVVVLRELPRAGESVERLVVTSDPLAPAMSTPAERHVLPPKVSQLLAEAHGAFDTQSGMRADDAGWHLACREAGSLEDEDHPAVESGRSKFTVRPEATVPVPWLPDPLAHGALLLGLPDVDPDAFELGVNRIPFTGPWPTRAAFRLAATGIREGAVRARPTLTHSADGRVLTVQLLPAETVTVRLSSYVDAGPNRANLFLFGVWQWIEGAAPPNLEALRDQAARGRNWLLMPPRKLVLVHAVQRPLRPPSFADGWTVERSSFDTTVASATGRVSAHEQSTSQVDVSATWTDVVDEVADDGSRPRPVQRAAPLGHLRVPEDLERGFEGSALEIGDTRRHRVRCLASATTRFREYFPREMATADLVRPGLGEAPVMTAEFDLPATSRPASPAVRYVVPTFEWLRNRRVEGDVLFAASSRGRGLRIFLERPWYSSGEGELLGVVFVPGRPPSDERLRSLVTIWGADPLWEAQPSDGSLSPEAFRGAVVEDGLTLEELPGGPAVSVAGYPVHYDAEREAWCADVEFDLRGPDKTDLHHFPFVRLALARYQPGALRIDGRDCKLSQVVVTDPVQLTDQRHLLVRALPPEAGLARRRVQVIGPRPRRLDGMGTQTRMVADVVSRRWEGDDLGWVGGTGFPLELTMIYADGRALWDGVVRFPTGRGPHLVVVKELEAVHPQVSVYSIDPCCVEENWKGDVTVRGSGFRSGADLSIDAVLMKADSVRVVSEGELKATVLLVPAGQNQPIREVRVTNPEGAGHGSCPCFVVGELPDLVITDVQPNPSQIPTPSQGQDTRKVRLQVTIIGSRFREGTQLSFTSVIANRPDLGHDGTVVLSDTRAYVDIHATPGTYEVQISDHDRGTFPFGTRLEVESWIADPP